MLFFFFQFLIILPSFCSIYACESAEVKGAMLWCITQIKFVSNSSFRSGGESTEKVSYFICYFLWVLGEWDTNETLPIQLAATYSEMVFLTGKSKKVSKLLQHLKCNPVQKTSSRQFIPGFIVWFFFYKPDNSKDKINSRAKHCPGTRSRCKPTRAASFVIPTPRTTPTANE